MREILFRGKTKGNVNTKDDVWVYGLPFYNGNGIIDGIESKDGKLYYVIPETVGQYVGLKDKNGKKVFEGDILVFCKGATYPYQIKWDGMGWKLYRADGKRIKEAFECNEIHYVNISEVIGNIHDNPELLEN